MDHSSPPNYGVSSMHRVIAALWMIRSTPMDACEKNTVGGALVE